MFPKLHSIIVNDLETQSYRLQLTNRNKPNVLKFKNIMTVTKTSDLLKLCKMIKVINEGVCAPG